VSEPRIPRQKNESPIFGSALHYSRQGWPVVPLHSVRDGRCTCGRADCGNPGKHPRIAKWQIKASKDPAQVAAWWQKWPTANIGVVTGVRSGFFVLDVDPDKGGEQSLRELEKKHGKLPDTARQRTGGGGRHLLFRHPGRDVGNRVALAAGLDVRGDGGLIVAAPSLHASGKRYEWESSAAPAEAPAWLSGLVLEKDGRKLAPEDWGKDIPDGRRDVELTRRVGKLVRDGHPPAAVLAMAHGLNAGFCKPPLARGQVEKIVKSIVERDADRREGPGKREFRTVTTREMFGRYGEQEPRWTVDGWLPEASCGLIVSPPGSYKTWLLAALAFAVATGRGFLGHYPVTGKGPVLHIQQEDPFPMLMGRVAAMFCSGEPTEKRTGKDVAYSLDCSFVEEMLEMPVHWHEDRELNLEDKGCMARVAVKIAEIRPVLVTIDPLYSGVSARDYMALGAQAMLQLKRLRDEYGCSFAVAHHTTVAGARSEDRSTIWGSQFLNAWLEFGWRVRETNDENAIKVIRHFKGSKNPKKLRLRFNITNYSFGVEIDEKFFESVPERIEEAILNGGRFGTERAVADAVGCGPAAVHKAAKKIGLKKDREGYYIITPE